MLSYRAYMNNKKYFLLRNRKRAVPELYFWYMVFTRMEFWGEEMIMMTP